MPSMGRRNPKEIQPKGVCQAPLPCIKERLSLSPSIKNSVERHINLMQSDLSLTSPYAAVMLLAGSMKSRLSNERKGRTNRTVVALDYEHRS